MNEFAATLNNAFHSFCGVHALRGTDVELSLFKGGFQAGNIYGYDVGHEDGSDTGHAFGGDMVITDKETKINEDHS